MNSTSMAMRIMNKSNIVRLGLRRSFSTRRASPKSSAIKLIPHFFFKSYSIFIIRLNRMNRFDIRFIISTHWMNSKPIKLTTTARTVAAFHRRKLTLLDQPLPPPFLKHTAAQPSRDFINCKDDEIR
ncbi:hypothetical protein Lal_00032661 [Lupinus albus]|nr:hypothetical protein Lal_00032661 [Lupinus albus]